MITTIEAHIALMLAAAANFVTTVMGLRALRARLNGHIEAHRTGERVAGHQPPPASRDLHRPGGSL